MKFMQLATELRLGDQPRPVTSNFVFVRKTKFTKLLFRLWKIHQP